MLMKKLVLVHSGDFGVDWASRRECWGERFAPGTALRVMAAPALRSFTGKMPVAHSLRART